MKKNTVRRTLVLVGFGALLAAGVSVAAPADADGYIDSAEQSYIDAYAAGAICPVLDQYPTIDGVHGVMLGIMDDGFSADNAVDIINAGVWAYCPRHWTLLENVGAQARGETQGFIA